METKICIYCGRTLDLSMLSEKAGTYRCKDENDCLAYQTGDEEDDSIDHPDYISDIVKSSGNVNPKLTTCDNRILTTPEHS